jgi:hypothetical protein
VPLRERGACDGRQILRTQNRYIHYLSHRILYQPCCDGIVVTHKDAEK